MSKPDPSHGKKERNKTVRWVVTIFLVTIFVTALISLASEEIIKKSGILVSFIILMVIVLIGIIFDIIGVQEDTQHAAYQVCQTHHLEEGLECTRGVPS